MGYDAGRAPDHPRSRGEYYPGRTSAGPANPDHPRSRGEYTILCIHFWRLYGSSPLSRGIPAVGDVDLDKAGIIPALAGNTILLDDCVPTREDHPRSRGEYDPRGSSASSALGSSPLSRGILEHQKAMDDSLRIIPALAGNTASVWA